jgi:hypothetical protein
MENGSSLTENDFQFFFHLQRVCNIIGLFFCEFTDIGIMIDHRVIILWKLASLFFDRGIYPCCHDDWYVNNLADLLYKSVGKFLVRFYSHLYYVEI